jgi:hypothetical protein
LIDRRIERPALLTRMSTVGCSSSTFAARSVDRLDVDRSAL